MPSGVYVRTDEMRKKISLANKGNKNMLGKRHTEEMKKKLSMERKGKHFSPRTEFKKGSIPVNKGKTLEEMYSEEKVKEMKLKNSLWHKNRHYSDATRKKCSESHKGEKAYWFGKKLSEQTKKKLSKSHMGNNNRIGTKHSKETLIKLKEARKKRILPTKDTTIEIKIQKFLKLLKIEFFTHQYINIQHGYQCDVFIPTMNLVLECDGDYFHKYPIGREIDHIRTKEMLEKGFKVLRLWEHEINKMNIEDFKNYL